MENWQIIILLLSLQWVVDGATSNDLKRIIVDAMVSHGGLIPQTMASRYITFEANGVILCFKVLKIWVIILFKDQNAPFMICVHCMNH